MRIQQTNPIFRANYYNFTKNGTFLRVNQIKTDNEDILPVSYVIEDTLKLY